MPNQYNAADSVNVPRIKYPNNLGYGAPLGPSGENREVVKIVQAEGTRISILSANRLSGNTLLDAGIYTPIASGTFSGTIAKF